MFCRSWMASTKQVLRIKNSLLKKKIQNRCHYRDRLFVKSSSDAFDPLRFVRFFEDCEFPFSLVETKNNNSEERERERALRWRWPVGEQMFGILVRRNELCKCFTSRKIERRKTNGELPIVDALPPPCLPLTTNTFPSARWKSRSDITRHEIKCRMCHERRLSIGTR